MIPFSLFILIFVGGMFVGVFMSWLLNIKDDDYEL